MLLRLLSSDPDLVRADPFREFPGKEKVSSIAPFFTTFLSHAAKKIEETLEIEAKSAVWMTSCMLFEHTPLSIREHSHSKSG